MCAIICGLCVCTRARTVLQGCMLQGYFKLFHKCAPPRPLIAKENILILPCLCYLKISFELYTLLGLQISPPFFFSYWLLVLFCIALNS